MPNITNKYGWLFLFCLFCLPSTSQVKTDTIRWSNTKLVIRLPEHVRTTTSPYEEGIFKYYVCPQDSGIICVHCGYMVKKPLLTSGHALAEHTFSRNGIAVKGEHSGYYDENEQKYYFREVNYHSEPVSVYYDKVPKNRTESFDRILDSIQIEKL